MFSPIRSLRKIVSNKTNNGVQKHNPKEEELFKISIIGTQGIDDKPLRLSLNPSVKSMGGGYMGMLFMNGFFYFINLEPKSDFKIFEKIFLKKIGEIEIPLLRGNILKDFLKSFGLPDNFVDNSF